MKADGGTSTFAGIYQYDRLNRLRYSKRAEWSGSAFLAPTDKLASEYRYDPNGNIQALRRAVEREQSGVFANFDEFRYDYTGGTNKLSLLHDSSAVRFAPDGTASSASNPNNTDITGTRAYLYDEAGNVRSDAGRTITWTPYGKVETVQKETGAGEVRFIYDAQGNRVLKEETGAGGTVSKRTWYVRDAAGQHLTTYEQSGGSGTPRAKEYLLYGSTRLGTAYADNAHGGAPVSGALYRRVVGQKQYELSDHLGNVRATVGDIKVRSGSTFAARVASYTEYFPFGMVASTATVAGGVGGRFGFNGMEKDNEVKGEGNHVDFGARWYDTRIARWGSVDPLAREYEDVSTYAFALNNPISYVDADGKIVRDQYGRIIYTITKDDDVYELEQEEGKVTSFKAKSGYMLADDGTRIKIYISTDNTLFITNPDGSVETRTEGIDNTYNCVGNTIANGQFAIKVSDLPLNFLSIEGYSLIDYNNKQPGDIGVYQTFPGEGLPPLDMLKTLENAYHMERVLGEVEADSKAGSAASYLYLGISSVNVPNEETPWPGGTTLNKLADYQVFRKNKPNTTVPLTKENDGKKSVAVTEDEMKGVEKQVTTKPGE